MHEFTRDAKGLAKNPLGIIALFITMVYGFACLVVSFGSKSLDKTMQIPLVWFLVLFPIMILISFVFLVVKHHQKLYAPSDFKDEGNFIKTIDPKRQSERLKDEIKQSSDSLHNDESDEKANTDKKIVDTIEDGSRDKNDKTEYDSEKDRSDYKPVKQEYLLAEELAIRKLEFESNINIRRQVRIEFPNGIIEADGYASIKNKNYIYEIKYVLGKNIPQGMIRNIENLIYIIDKNTNKFKVVFVIVHNNGSGESIKEQLYNHFGNHNRRYQFKFYNINKLKGQA